MALDRLSRRPDYTPGTTDTSSADRFGRRLDPSALRRAAPKRPAFDVDRLGAPSEQPEKPCGRVDRQLVAQPEQMLITGH